MIFFWLAEVADGADDAVVAAHLRPAPHAEIEAVMRAVEGVHVALEVVERTANPRYAAEGCAGGWVVRDAGLGARQLPQLRAGCAPNTSSSFPTSRRG